MVVYRSMDQLLKAKAEIISALGLATRSRMTLGVSDKGFRVN
jgi:hypothetical protein